ncbi:MAG: NTP transferase domain-containing protein [Candidatus Ranarchaeia archaeon]
MGDQFVLLAAGNGIRMGTTHLRCKSLINLFGISLLEHHLKSINQCFPTVDEVLVVVGSFANKIKSHINKLKSNYRFTIKSVINKTVDRENGYSLLLTKPHITENTFYFAMADHFAAPSIYQALQKGYPNKLTVCADTNPKYQLPEPSLKISLDHDKNILDIGEKIRNWDAIDIGFFQGTKETFANLHLLEKNRHKVTVTDAVRLHVNNKTAKAIVITGNYWTNINTLETLKQAKKSIIKNHPFLIPRSPPLTIGIQRHTDFDDHEGESSNA